ncbi:signal transduction histidine kinase [Oxalobacteraceae bacterium GrIS 2.11]
MYKLKTSIAARLVLGYGLMVAAAIAVLSGVFYFGTVGALDDRIDSKIVAISNRLIDTFERRPIGELSEEIERELNDGIDSDTEILLVVSPAGKRVVGNLLTWPDASAPLGELIKREVVRAAKSTSARLLIRELPDGERLFVGHDLLEHDSVRNLVLRSLAVGGVLSLLLATVGAFVFRRQIEGRINDIRRTAHQIELGDLTPRIPISSDDEFGLLSHDINRMLDRIENLMDGVRHVSNAIAHDLRTPLSRIRSKLDDAVRHKMTVEILADAAHSAIGDIDSLIFVFERLLQISEAESGVRTQSFESVNLNDIGLDMVDLFDATAEERQVVLKTSFLNDVCVIGDRHLLKNAVASLIDNAIKYAGVDATVEVGTVSGADSSSIFVRDNGPGIPIHELSKVTERFYRLDSSRSQPGNGLGLSIVSAIAAMHGGVLILEDDHGLTARIVLPHAEAGVDDTAS